MIKKYLMAFVALLILHLPALAEEYTDSLESYTNQTVSTTICIQGRDTLNVSNVNVTSTGNLNLTSPDGIVISGNIEVVTGGTLNLYGGKQNYIRFFYSGKGNRIRRENEITNN